MKLNKDEIVELAIRIGGALVVLAVAGVFVAIAVKCLRWAFS